MKNNPILEIGDDVYLIGTVIDKSLYNEEEDLPDGRLPFCRYHIDVQGSEVVLDSDENVIIDNISDFKQLQVQKLRESIDNALGSVEQWEKQIGELEG